jgi:hypothetical protein
VTTRSGSIELFGVPGAGKSTLYAHLADRLSGIDDGWELTPKAGMASLVRRSPSQVAVAFARGLAAGPRTVTSRAGVQLTSSVARQAVAIATARRYCVFHEGAVNAAWRVQFESDLALPVRWLRAVLPASDLVVVLDVDGATARERIRSKRRQGPINRRLAEAPLDSETWARAFAAYRSIREAIGLGDGVFVVENAGSVAEAAGAVAERIAAQLA